MSPKTALMVMDYQAGNMPLLESYPSILPLLSKTLTGARSGSIQVIYVIVSFRPGHPEVSPSNVVFYPAAKAGKFVAGSPESLIPESITPQEGDIVVEKKRVSAFTGSGLDLILKSLGVENLVLGESVRAE